MRTVFISLFLVVACQMAPSSSTVGAPQDGENSGADKSSGASSQVGEPTCTLSSTTPSVMKTPFGRAVTELRLSTSEKAVSSATIDDLSIFMRSGETGSQGAISVAAIATRDFEAKVKTERGIATCKTRISVTTLRVPDCQLSVSGDKLLLDVTPDIVMGTLSLDDGAVTITTGVGFNPGQVQSQYLFFIDGDTVSFRGNTFTSNDPAAIVITFSGEDAEGNALATCAFSVS